MSPSSDIPAPPIGSSADRRLSEIEYRRSASAYPELRPPEMHELAPRRALGRSGLSAVEPGGSTPVVIELIDTIPAAIVGVDSHGRVLVWNRAAETLFGWPRHEVVGRQPPIIPTQLRHEWRLQMRQVLEGGRGTDAAETQRVDRAGKLVPVLRSSAPLVGPDGKVMGVLDTLTDITAHNQLGEESRALTQVRERELIAMDLHDGVIQSLYALALSLAAEERSEDFDPDAARVALRRSREEIEKLIEEMRSYLLDLRAREFAPRELASGLRLLLDALRLNAGIEPRLELEQGVDEQLTPEVRGHLLFVTREAVSNILRHAEATEVSISVRCIEDQVVLTVSDNGRGFEPAATSGKARREQRGVHNMASRARLIGGRFELDSSADGGTRVQLSIPIPTPVEDD